MQILYSDGNNLRFLRVNEYQHKRSGEYKYGKRDSDTENRSCNDGTPDTFAYALGLFCSEILCNERRKSISEILYRHIGERIYFDSYCKCCHYRCAETVNQSLYH